MTRPPAARSESQPGGVRRPGRRRGTTLVEVMVVAVVLAAGAGVLVSSASGWAGFAAGDAARSLADDLRYARGRAVVTGRPHAVAVDRARGVLTVTDAGGADVPDPRRPGRAGPFERRFGADGGRVRLEEPVRTADGAAASGVTFLPTGATDDPAADVAFWLSAPAPAGGAGWVAVRARVVGTTGQVWADGPHPHDATLGAWLRSGEAGLGAD